MNRFILPILLIVSFVLAHIAASYADDQVQLRELYVKESVCTLVAAESATGSTLVGGAVGATGGAILGRMIFGRKATTLSGIAGGVAGAMVGNAASEKSYHCKMLVEKDKVLVPYEATRSSRVTAGYQYKFSVVDNKLVTMY